MNKKLQGALMAAFLAVAAVGGSSIAAAQEMTATAAAQPVKADYRWLLSIAEVQTVTGFADLRLKSIDAKKSGEAADLTFSAAEGRRIVMVQILRGQDFDMYYREFSSQDFKAWPDAFWGPKQTDPPSMFWFRKGDTLILISCDLDDREKPYIVPGMFIEMARIIAGRIPAQGI